MRKGIAGGDVVMMLRLQLERMDGGLVPSRARVSSASSAWTARSWPSPRRMRWSCIPGPMNRGVEIDSDVADDPERSLIQDQVEMGVAAPHGGAGLAARGTMAE